MAEHRFGQVVDDADDFIETLGLVERQKCFAITFRPVREDLASVVDQVCECAFQVGHLTLALEEVPHYSTASSMPAGLDLLARMGRHREVDLIYTGQRFAELPRRLTATTDYFVLFGQREPRDLEALAERVGRAVADQVERLPLHSYVVYDVLARRVAAEG